MDKLNSDTSRYEVVDHSTPASFLIPGTDEIEQSRDHGCKQDFRLRPGFSEAGRRDPWRRGWAGENTKHHAQADRQLRFMPSTINRQPHHRAGSSTKSRYRQCSGSGGFNREPHHGWRASHVSHNVQTWMDTHIRRQVKRLEECPASIPPPSPGWVLLGGLTGKRCQFCNMFALDHN